MPVVAVAGHKKIPGVTNVVLDHARAAELSLRHLHRLGHRQIAFMRGQPFSADSDERWRSIVNVARELGIEIRPELTIHLEQDLTSPELGYPVVQQLLQHRTRFTALVSFNDIAAIGAIRALRDANLRVPDDISVIGFDDIQMAAYHTPRLTTIRQPLHNMGKPPQEYFCSEYKDSRTTLRYFRSRRSSSFGNRRRPRVIHDGPAAERNAPARERPRITVVAA
jgi:DNA-binding LacI/PurR family transcriptional regulator